MIYVLFHSSEINVPGAVITSQRNVITASAYHYNSSCERTEVNCAHLSACQMRLWKFTALWWEKKPKVSPFSNYVIGLFVAWRISQLLSGLQRDSGHALVNKAERAALTVVSK